MTETLKVLVVDDEPYMCQGVTRALRNYKVLVEDVKVDVDFDVMIAENGEEMLKIITENTFDIILLDYKLPDYNGLELLDTMIKKDKDIIVIMITAYATFETAVQATKMGAHDFIAKPFTPQELRYSLKKAATHLLLTRHARNLEEEKRRIRFQFISILSHELKSPIGAIEGYLHLLKRKRGNLKQEDYDMMIDRSVERLSGMKKLILDLLDLTKIEAGDRTRDIKNLKFKDMIISSIESYKQQVEDKKLEITYSLNDVVFPSDETEMSIVFNNLISNAIKYNKNNGSVSITLKEDDKCVIFSVADTGIGIEKENIGKLFKDFVRIKNSSTANISGSGLGLSTVKKILELYKGKIEIKSEQGVGSCFTVTLNKKIEEEV